MFIGLNGKLRTFPKEAENYDETSEQQFCEICMAGRIEGGEHWGFSSRNVFALALCDLTGEED